jgi:hypothetical protein
VVSNIGGQDGALVGYVPILADLNRDGKADVLWDKRSGPDTHSHDGFGRKVSRARGGGWQAGRTAPAVWAKRPGVTSCQAATLALGGFRRGGSPGAPP